MYTLKKFILLENDASYFITIYDTSDDPEMIHLYQ